MTGDLQFSQAAKWHKFAAAGVTTLATGILTGLAQLSPALVCFWMVVAAIVISSRKSIGQIPSATWPALFGSLAFWCFLAWASDLDQEIIVTHFRECGTMEAMQMVVLPPLAALLAFGLGVGVMGLDALWPKLLRRMVQVSAIASGMLAMGTLPFVAYRSLSLPADSDYVSQLPVLASLDAVREADFQCAPDERESRGGSPAQVCYIDTQLPQGLALRRSLRHRPDYVDCSVGMGSADAPSMAELQAGLAPEIFCMSPLQVSTDVKHGLVVILERGGWRSVAWFRPFFRSDWTEWAAFTNVRPSDVPGSVRPSLWVLAFGSLAALMTLSGLGLQQWWRRQARRLLGEREGTIDASGWLTLDADLGARPVRVDGEQPGRVLVLARSEGDVYRGGGFATVIRTTHAEVKARLRAREEQLLVALGWALPFALLPVGAAIALGLIF